MKTRVRLLAVGVSLFTAHAAAQTVLFDFDSAPPRAPLPIRLTIGGITAQFSATGQGFSIQEANTLGFTPTGFAGYCVYPGSVFAADLLVAFSRPLTSFSILYAPEEYACDSSARMRVTADLDGLVVGTSTTTADPPGTWPSATLAFSSAQTFNHVVIHYDAPPPTGGDWGPIFMSDNMTVVSPPTLRIALADPYTAVLAWAAAATGFTLQQSADPAPGSWSNVTNTVNTVGDENQVIVALSPGGRFYRLSQP